MSRGRGRTPRTRFVPSATRNMPAVRPGESRPAVLLFTDLDGTLLDSRTYSFEPARRALGLLKNLGIPLIICSSKTRPEIEHYRRRLANSDPFIAENGGGVFIPKGYFPAGVVGEGAGIEERGDYEVIRLGATYRDLRLAVEQLRREGFDLRGFGDMTPEEVAHITGLTLEEAAMARERDFDEPFVLEKGTDLAALRERVRRLGFNSTQGTLYHILGQSDKGKAVTVLSDLYRQALGSIVTIGLGDSPNDASMLECVDYPVLVQKPDGGYDPGIALPNLIRADGTGPLGWNTAVLGLIERSPWLKARADAIPHTSTC